jgi:hypothetical protein
MSQPGASHVPITAISIAFSPGKGRARPAASAAISLDTAGLLSGGFAVIAWPAKYGNSGVMTFQMNQQGIVFQRDLGADTATLAAAITRYDLDSEWTPTGDSIESADDTAVTSPNTDASKEP